jgi:hypothetical protein
MAGGFILLKAVLSLKRVNLEIGRTWNFDSKNMNGQTFESPKEKVLSKVKTIFHKSIPEEINTVLSLDYQKMDDYNHPISGYAVDTLRIALWSWLTSENYFGEY